MGRQLYLFVTNFGIGTFGLKVSSNPIGAMLNRPSSVVVMVRGFLGDFALDNSRTSDGCFSAFI